MRDRRNRALAAFGSLVLIAVMAGCSAPSQQTMGGAGGFSGATAVPSLVGTWILDTKLSHSDTAAVGNNPKGILIFDASRFSFILMGDDNKLYNQHGSSSSNNRRQGGIDHALGTIAYWGEHYDVSCPTSPGNGFCTLTLTLTDHSYRDFVQGDHPQVKQLRQIRFTAASTSSTQDELEFENKQSSTGVNSYLVFYRQ